MSAAAVMRRSNRRSARGTSSVAFFTNVLAGLMVLRGSIARHACLASVLLDARSVRLSGGSPRDSFQLTPPPQFGEGVRGCSSGDTGTAAQATGEAARGAGAAARTGANPNPNPNPDPNPNRNPNPSPNQEDEARHATLVQERREIILGPRSTTSRRPDAVLPTDLLEELRRLQAEKEALDKGKLPSCL